MQIYTLPPGHALSEAMAVAVNELHMGALGLECGNEGRVRVCARRAVSRFLLASQLFPGTVSENALANLRWLSGNEALPVQLREAAERLLGGIRSVANGEPYSKEPLQDAILLINYFCEQASL